MPIYISRGRFTAEAVKGMLAKPENCEEAVDALFKTVGGRLETVAVRQGTGPRAMVSVLFISLTMAVVGGLALLVFLNFL